MGRLSPAIPTTCAHGHGLFTVTWPDQLQSGVQVWTSGYLEREENWTLLSTVSVYQINCPSNIY